MMICKKQKAEKNNRKGRFIIYKCFQQHLKNSTNGIPKSIKSVKRCIESVFKQINYNRSICMNICCFFLNKNVLKQHTKDFIQFHWSIGSHSFVLELFFFFFVYHYYYPNQATAAAMN